MLRLILHMGCVQRNKCFLSRSSSSSIWFQHLVFGKFFFWKFYRLMNDTVSYYFPTLYIHKYIHKWVFIYLKLNLLLHFAQQMFFLQCAFLNINDDMHPYKQNVQQSPYLWITLYFKGKWILKLKIAPGGRETIAMVGIQTLAYFNF